jgi:uncharacterized protein
VSTPLTPIPQDSFTNFAPAPAPARVVNPDNPPWGLPSALLLLVMSFVLMVVVQALFVFPYAARRGIPFTTNAITDFLTKDPTAIFLEIASVIPAHILTFGLAWLLVTRGGKYPFLRTLGWEWDARFTFWRCAGIAVALLIAAVGILRLTGSPQTALDQAIESSRAAALATAFAATFTAPLIEEIVFRGLLYSALRRFTGTVAAVVIVSLFFAAIHVPQYLTSIGVITTILLLSFTLTTIRAYTGKLLPCFLVHTVFNAIQSLLIVLEPYTKHLSPEQTPAPGALLACVVKLLTLSFF